MTPTGCPTSSTISSRSLLLTCMSRVGVQPFQPCRCVFETSKDCIKLLYQSSCDLLRHVKDWYTTQAHLPSLCSFRLGHCIETSCWYIEARDRHRLQIAALRTCDIFHNALHGTETHIWWVSIASTNMRTTATGTGRLHIWVLTFLVLCSWV